MLPRSNSPNGAQKIETAQVIAPIYRSTCSVRPLRGAALRAPRKDWPGTGPRAGDPDQRLGQHACLPCAPVRRSGPDRSAQPADPRLRWGRLGRSTPRRRPCPRPPGRPSQPVSRPDQRPETRDRTPPGQGRARLAADRRWPTALEEVPGDRPGGAEPADKPGSVVDSHSSRRSVAATLKQPTRRQRGPRHSLPIWFCSRWGLPCRSVAGLAVRSYRTVSPLPRASEEAVRRSALCCTFRRLAPPRRYLAPCPVEPGLSSAPGRTPMTRLPGRLRGEIVAQARLSK